MLYDVHVENPDKTQFPKSGQTAKSERGGDMEFEELDRIIGDHAPFLISLSDGSQEELRLVIAAAEGWGIGR